MLIKYIGKRPEYTDGAYATKISFAQGETKNVPDDIGINMLRHPDVYAKGDATEAVEEQPIPVVVKHDDEADKSQEIRDAVNVMDKESLSSFAKIHFSAELDKRQGVDKMRQTIIGMIDQYGLE